MNVYSLCNPLPRLPHPPTIVNMKINREGVYVFEGVLSIQGFLRSLTPQERIVFKGLRNRVRLDILAGAIGSHFWAQEFRQILRGLVRDFNAYWGRAYGEFFFTA